MSEIVRKVKAKVGVFFYDYTTKKDIEYFREYDLNCKDHGEFSEFMEKIYKSGALKNMRDMFGDIPNFTDLSNKYYFIEELYVFVPTTEERFNEMCLKWEALFKQNGVI